MLVAVANQRGDVGGGQAAGGLGLLDHLAERGGQHLAAGIDRFVTAGEGGAVHPGQRGQLRIVGVGRQAGPVGAGQQQRAGSFAGHVALGVGAGLEQGLPRGQALHCHLADVGMQAQQQHKGAPLLASALHQQLVGLQPQGLAAIVMAQPGEA